MTPVDEPDVGLVGAADDPVGAVNLEQFRM
jgi:hypothetical protein